MSKPKRIRNTAWLIVIVVIAVFLSPAIVVPVFVRPAMMKHAGPNGELKYNRFLSSTMSRKSDTWYTRLWHASGYSTIVEYIRTGGPEHPDFHRRWEAGKKLERVD